MLGRVDDESLRDLFRRARALIFPQVEDFGIIPVEAQACGCPVLAFRAGGALDIVSPGSGAFFDEQDVDAVGAAVAGWRDLDAADCRANAERFSEAVVDDAIHRHVTEVTSG